jgi:hypothetical protein
VLLYIFFLTDVNKAKDKIKSFNPKAPTQVNPQYKYRRQSKVGSVEDLLEGLDSTINPVMGDKQGQGGRTPRSGQSFSRGPPSEPPPFDIDGDEGSGGFSPPPPSDTVKGHRRKELLDDRIRKPKYSVRRVNQLCKWINGLHIWPTALDIPGKLPTLALTLRRFDALTLLSLGLHREICSGLLLAKLMQVLIPSVSFVNLNTKARSKKAAIDNLEQALGVIWRSKSGCNTSRIPKSTDIYDGSTSAIAMLLQELFEVYVVKPLYQRNAVRILSWFHTILKQYQLGLNYSGKDAIILLIC